MPRYLRIQPFMGLGNRMFQYMLAEAIRHVLPDAVLCGPGLPEWGIGPVAEPPRQPFAMGLCGHTIPLQQTLALARQVPDLDIFITALSARLCHYAPHRSHYQSLFPLSGSPSASDDQLVINIRLGDIAGGYHPNYMPLPLRWYHDLVGQTGKRPLFMGQLGDDAYSQALRSQFPQADFMPSRGPRGDFDFFARASHIVPAISTFSWLAAWLSPQARTIHFPVAALYNPAARLDHDLLPLADPRYRFYQSALQGWSGSSADMDYLIRGLSDFVPIGPDALQARFPTIGTEGLGIPSPALGSFDPALARP